MSWSDRFSNKENEWICPTSDKKKRKSGIYDNDVDSISEQF